ncbi:bifunctional proline dehydrogenase/L-glutamate gamma-semialdehyde dehydrogenase PutA [Komagataeibacter saccharivorans]|uniref:bifunctional proline dehydrogenase/L-glutamate gamma-semialdehyde dehydrogenase PutA n=1 Tax=Komagataeibacter saccharivorans TaxID=265959 RepID=UPI0024A9C2F9|nr:bifunctional proline dehydrogenase/L-glutamate gamma-semialdehyde dehydrogenase PutA [Komagataeibacter saccharivorans]
MLLFKDFAGKIAAPSPLRQQITEATRRSEIECINALTPAATLSDAEALRTTNLATTLTEGLRRNRNPGGVEALVQEFSLSSAEGVALMCLAEALLRIPDNATRDALIRDKIGTGDWLAHISRDRPLFTNAAAWGLLVTGRLTSPGARENAGLSETLRKLVARSSGPLIRKAVDVAMRLMGEQFVVGETIESALKNSEKLEEQGFRYSYDMLGEAALTAHDAERYRQDYITAIHAIGRRARGADVYERPGISIKLSALHPRYSRAQRDRVMAELLPVVVELTVLARHYDIGLNIDAEESERLEISLDLLEALCLEPALKDWNGIGFVVQAYGRRAPFVLDFIIDLARRTGHRIMVRLVKGAYWDSEIKKAQIDGMPDFPVYTRKVHTDISYIACARKLLGARDAIFPQFATHNARSLATIYTLAGEDFHTGSYEFQCLHGMGEPLYKEVVGPQKLNRPTRIYAPVGTHETLLAYLVRRLLENGANSSFVNQIGDENIPVSQLVADPMTVARSYVPYGGPNPAIAAPPDMFAPERRNSAGLDLTDENALVALGRGLDASPAEWTATPMLATPVTPGTPHDVTNPADRRERVGQWTPADATVIPGVMEDAVSGAATWAAQPPASRAEKLERAADLMEGRQDALLGLIVREAGKSFPNALAEIREAVDFLRYYAAQIRADFDNATHIPLGPVACISPWNFPLAIFTGQVAAALAAGNSVIAKPAEETPLVAAQAVAILHEAGVPADALQLLPGAGDVGAALVQAAQVAGVMFTGSTTVAQSINRQLVSRRGHTGQPVPLVAETGGQNAMIVDSSALAEQVVVDVIASAFDSAGQRCSALRILCVQHECADHLLRMLRGAMRELSLGNTARLATDIGPVITTEAAQGIQTHIQRLKDRGAPVYSLPLPDACAHGSFVAPTLIEIDSISDLGAEVFGPVLHVLRYRSQELDTVIDAINGLGYGLTGGVHTRIETTVQQVARRLDVGNLYVNRNTIGAVVGVQPFGGRGLSGTGPKAGGPLILRRLLAAFPLRDGLPGMNGGTTPAIMERWHAWLMGNGYSHIGHRIAEMAKKPLPGAHMAMPGPVGEENVYSFRPRGHVLCVGDVREHLVLLASLALSCGNTAFVYGPAEATAWLAELPPELAPHIRKVSDLQELACPVVMSVQDDALFRHVTETLAKGSGMIASTFLIDPDILHREFLIEEHSTSTNTAAAGGNATLMAIG